MALAASLGIDYVVNRAENRESISIAANEIGDYIRALKGQQKVNRTQDIYDTSLVAGVTALLVGGTIGIGYYMMPPVVPIPQGILPGEAAGALVQYGQDAVAAIPRLAAVGWGVYSNSMLGRDCARLINFGVSRILERGRDYWVGDTGEELVAFAERVQEMQPDSVHALSDILEEEARLNFWHDPQMRVIIPPGADIDSILSDLPGIPLGPQTHGQVVMITLEDGTEQAMVLPYSQSVTDIRFVPVVNAPQSALDSIARSMEEHKSPDPGDRATQFSESVDETETSMNGTEELSMLDADPAIMQEYIQGMWNVTENQMIALLNYYQQFFERRAIVVDGISCPIMGFVPMGDGQWAVVF